MLGESKFLRMSNQQNFRLIKEDTYIVPFEGSISPLRSAREVRGRKGRFELQEETFGFPNDFPSLLSFFLFSSPERRNQSLSSLNLSSYLYHIQLCVQTTLFSFCPTLERTIFLERKEFIVLPSIPKSILWLCPNQKIQSPTFLDFTRLITNYLLKFLLKLSSHFLYPQLTPQMPDLPSLNISIVICVTCLLPICLNYYEAQ